MIPYNRFDKKHVIPAQAGTSLAVIPAQAGIQSVNNRVATKPWLVPLRGVFLIDWIPACAGMTATRLRRSQAGFTYVGLLIIVAIMGVTLAGIGTMWHTKQQRVREQQLLFIGGQFSQALNAYFQNSPGGVPQFPKKLEDLLQDKRYPNTVRYLRKIFADPMTGDTQWGLIKGADGGIVGIHSLSGLAPIKTDNFGKGFESLAGKKHYSDWQFTYRTNGNVMLAATAAPAPPPVVPPAYAVPPPLPLPANPTPNQRRDNFCQITFSTDAMDCARLAVRFGDAAGVRCMASARARNAACMSNDAGTSMPVLDVQYQ